MNSLMEVPRWHAIHVRPRFERIVASHLKAYGVEQYLPLRRMTHQSGEKRRTIELPVFPGYVFCKCHASRHRSIEETPGVLGVWRGTNANDVVFEQELWNLRRVLEVGSRIRSWPFTAEGMPVMVETGPLSGITGVLELTSRERVFVLSVQLIRHSIAIEIDNKHEFSFVSRAFRARPPIAS
jgi:transcription antitermination factor NusG